MKIIASALLALSVLAGIAAPASAYDAKGFYGQLEAGKVPSWLQRVDLGKDSPFKMWRVVG